MTQNPIPGHLSGENQNSKGYINPNVHCSTIYNSQDMEATLMSIDGEMDKEVWYKYTMEYYYQSLQSCPTLSDSMDCSLPGSSVHGIFQARILEWVAIAFSEQSYFWVNNQRTTWFGRIHAPQCSLQHCLQQARRGSNLNVHEQRNR